jgi:hypothetical protein
VVKRNITARGSYAFIGNKQTFQILHPAAASVQWWRWMERLVPWTGCRVPQATEEDRQTTVNYLVLRGATCYTWCFYDDRSTQTTADWLAGDEVMLWRAEKPTWWWTDFGGRNSGGSNR